MHKKQLATPTPLPEGVGQFTDSEGKFVPVICLIHWTNLPFPKLHFTYQLLVTDKHINSFTFLTILKSSGVFPHQVPVPSCCGDMEQIRCISSRRYSLAESSYVGVTKQDFRGGDRRSPRFSMQKRNPIVLCLPVGTWAKLFKSSSKSWSPVSILV